MIDKTSVEVIVNKVVDELQKDFIIIPKFKPLMMDNHHQPFLELVMQFVCKEFGLLPEQVKADSRKEPAVSARQLFFYLSKKFKAKHIPDEDIAGFVNRSRTLAINTPNTMLNTMSVDKKYNAKISGYEEKFNEILKLTYA